MKTYTSQVRMAKSKYDTPRVTEYGSVEDVTQDFNKIGSGTDEESSDDNNLVGSKVPV